MPIRTIAIIGLSFPLRANPLAGLLAGSLVSNPLTYIPQYYFSISIGNFLTPYNISWDRFERLLNIILLNHNFDQSLTLLLNLGFESIIVLIIGGMVLACPFSILSYYIFLKFLKNL